MANKRLSDEVIAARMVELRNLRKLHAAAREREILKDARITELEANDAKQQQTIETLRIQMAELQTMVFGKKKRPPTGGTPLSKGELFATPKLPRNKDSYRRPLPPAAAITATEIVPVDRCECGGELKDVTTHERYQEDVPLPELTPDYQARLVTKYVITRGTCTSCGKATSGRNLGGQAVRLGPNVRLLICHLVSVVGMSYNGVAELLRSLYGITVSDGEIANILAKQHQAWLPAYEQLKADIRATPAVHVDETAWAIQQNDGLGYAWCLSDSGSEKVYYSLENSRGAIHARSLIGDQFTGVRISDDYGVYRALPGIQQLCWAHLYRGIRDLRYNDNLPEEQLPDVIWWYEQFAAIYQDLRLCLDEPYDQTTRTTQANDLWQRLRLLLPASSNEPVKLTKLKAQLTRAGPTKLFACLTYDTPCDNNRAERDLRQLVLKRKRSFGSQTEKGAKVLSTVLSICTTTWRGNPTSYFRSLAALG
jgi:transposase